MSPVNSRPLRAAARYVVRVPAGTEASRVRSCSFARCAQDARQIALATGSAPRGFPGVSRALPEQPASINPAKAGGGSIRRTRSRWHGEPALLAELTSAVSRQFGADTSRVSSLGISAGGAMAVTCSVRIRNSTRPERPHSGVRLSRR